MIFSEQHYKMMRDQISLLRPAEIRLGTLHCWSGHGRGHRHARLGNRLWRPVDGIQGNSPDEMAAYPMGLWATSEAVQKVDRGTLHDRVYYEIRRALMEGGFAPGSTITLHALAQQAGTSIMPVRDALRRLVTEHALDLLPNRMVGVPVLTQDRLTEIRDIRLALESMGAALAAARIPDRDLVELAGIFEMLHGQRRSPVADYLTLVQDFHFTIYRAAGRPILLAMIETLWLQIGPLLSEIIRRSGQRLEPEHYHAVLVALRSRNGKAAGRALAAVVLAHSELMMDALQVNSSST